MERPSDRVAARPAAAHRPMEESQRRRPRPASSPMISSASRPLRALSVLVLIYSPCFLLLGANQAHCLAAAAAASGDEEALELVASSQGARMARHTQADEFDWPAEAQLAAPAYDYHANMPVITKRELANTIKQATSNVDKAYGQLQLERRRSASRDQLDEEANELASLLVFRKASPSDAALWNQTRQALISEEATRLLARQHKLSRAQVSRGLPLISVDQTSLGQGCPRPARTFACIPGRFRSLSGHCNNVQQPDWGVARAPLVRWAPARYADHVARPAGQQLPSARQVSLAVAEAARARMESGRMAPAHAHMTTMLSFFGQFVFNDLAHVPQFASAQEAKCCGRKQEASSHTRPQQPECMAVELGGGEFCLDYVRSTPAARQGCNLGPRDQLNLVSSYLDGSVIYGSSEAQLGQLRAFAGGRLRGQLRQLPGGKQEELLPQLGAAGDNATAAWPDGEQPDGHWLAAVRECHQMAAMRGRKAPEAEASCFLAGDLRANDNIGLTLMHTIWLREHNFIAHRLARLNPHWPDERLFQEARRIVVAELQHIAYSEFLPAVLGSEPMARLNLSTQSQGYAQLYDPALNAAVSNEIATAVFPFIYSTLPGALERYSDRLEMLGATRLLDTFMDGSELLVRNKFAQYLTGMMSQSAMEPALGLMPMAAANLSSSGGGGGGTRPARSAGDVDAVALAIQQGRDHGLSSYLYWRRACQLKPLVSNWLELEQVMPGEAVQQLRRVYASVHQLDLYLALLERPAPGATLGPTFVCLLARQFYQLKHGDRFWFENDLPELAFTSGQLDELRQSSLARVLCRNSQASISFVQPAPMLASDPFLNAYQYCTNQAMAELELAEWREPASSAQQPGGGGWRSSLARGKRLIEQNARLIVASLEQVGAQLDTLARRESGRLRSARLRATRAARATNGTHGTRAGKWHHHAAGYRHLARPKRQTLAINNRSVLLELATNEVVRSLVGRGKDRERGQPLQEDIRDFLYSLEAVQLDNLLENSAESGHIEQFISSANSFLLSEEQRARLPADRSSSLSMDCQDDERAFPCDHTAPFRTITGWCNNLRRPKWGQSFTLHERLLPNAYEDGLSKPRQFSVASELAGGERRRLPSPRRISTAMHEAGASQMHARYSLALMQFGQFGLDHDLTRTPFSVALDGSLLDCSACDSARATHRDCLPIEIPADDAHFESGEARRELGPGAKCLHFVRSLNGQRALGPRQQLNALTAYLDGSQIYGSDNCEAKSLRAFLGGRLNTSAYPAQPAAALGYTPRDTLPTTRLNPECVTPGGLCFHAGDQRASEQPGLTAFHTIFMRFHNSIVDGLAGVNAHWSDERLYQEGRRIVGAVLQRIAYGEFAPRLLGLELMSRYELLLKPTGYSRHYDASCSAGVLNEFAAAAFRMGHSLIRPAFPLLNADYKPVARAIQLRSAFFNSARLLAEPQLMDAIVRGIVSTPIETLDNAVTEELTNHLFERPRAPFSGMDLVSLNIQRARDHGLPGYNAYRAHCNLTRARTFQQLAGEVPRPLIKRLAALYASVDDIDLFTGGISETPVHGGIIGPTLGCIIGLQLARLKRCDRFWHETGDPLVRFTAPQLAQIRSMSLAAVLCSQSDTIHAIQRQAMDVPDAYLNPRVPCSSLGRLELAEWRDSSRANACLVQGAKIELGRSRRVSPCKSCTCTREGSVCRTAKIDCVKMMERGGAGVGRAMADRACVVQCAWALDMLPGGR